MVPVHMGPPRQVLRPRRGAAEAKQARLPPRPPRRRSGVPAALRPSWYHFTSHACVAGPCVQAACAVRLCAGAVRHPPVTAARAAHGRLPLPHDHPQPAHTLPHAPPAPLQSCSQRTSIRAAQALRTCCIQACLEVHARLATNGAANSSDCTDV